MNIPQDKMDAARRARAAGRINDARRLCAERLAAAPKDPAAQHFMATLAAEAGRLDIALGHAKKAAKLAPRAYPARLDLAKILLLSGKEAPALRESEAALALRPNDLAARFEHAKIVYNSSRIEAAEPLLLSIVAERPDLAEAHAMLAAIRMTKGRAADALDSADKAIAAGHNAADLHEIRGNALLGLERPEMAQEAFKRAVELAPERLSALRRLSLSSEAIGDDALAKAAFLRHIRLLPYEKQGEDSAKTRIIVGNRFNSSYSFQRNTFDQIYSGDNFISTFKSPDIQLIHYLVEHINPRAIIEQIGDAHLLFNNVCNAEVIVSLGVADRISESYEATGLPVINPIHKVIMTARAENYRRLKDDPAILFPRTVRYDVEDDPVAVAQKILDEFEPPFLIRPIHTNVRGGLRVIRHPRELMEGDGLSSLRSYYAIEFHRSVLRSPAGGDEGALQFRAAVVDGQIFPDRINWNPGDYTSGHIVRAELDYDRRKITDMEKTFLRAPEEILGGPLNQIFGNTMKTIDLDLYGIDFGLTEEGKIVVFEANAAMALFATKHNEYSPYRIEHRQNFETVVAAFFHERAGH